MSIRSQEPQRQSDTLSPSSSEEMPAGTNGPAPVSRTETPTVPLSPEKKQKVRREQAQRYLNRKSQRQGSDSAAAPIPQQSLAAITPLPALPLKDVAPPTPPPLAEILAEPITPPFVEAVSPLAKPTSAAIASPAATVAKARPTPLQKVNTTAGASQQQLLHRKWRLRHISRTHIRAARQREQRVATRLWLTIGSTVMLFLIVFLSMVGTGGYVAYSFYNNTQQQYNKQVLTLHDLLPRDNLKMYDRNRTIIDQLTDQGIHTTVTLDKVSQDLINATVATEDKNFWSNQGVDILRIIRAAIDDLRTGHVIAGGSTITQQLIKNLVVGNETTIVRKLEEIVLTPSVNDHYTKHDILEMYLNSIYYGEQAYGVDAAASVYFGFEDRSNKPASAQLDLAQAAMLAGIPSFPSAYDPLQHPTAGFQRFETVLDLMVQSGYITRVQAQDAAKEARRPGFFKRPASLADRAPHFANFVLTQLEQTFHLTRKDLSRSDMNVYTTLDIALQDKIQKIAQQHIAELRDEHNLTNAAEVLIDYHTGAIISLLGSIDYNDKSIDGEYDAATQAYRQPGSSFKPYVYVTAFEQGSSPAQAVADTPLTIYLPDSDPPTYSPTNYDLSYHGHMTLRCALQNSLNVPAVKVLQHVGIPNAMKTAYDMGITSYQGTPGYSLVLGGLGVRLIDHTSAIGAFANDGVHVPYYSVQKVVFPTLHKTYVHPPEKGSRAISQQLAYMMTSVLSDNSSRIPEFFDCNVLQLYSNSQEDCYNGNRGTVRPAAAKTGTTTDFRDNWTVGYTTDYVMGVWAGNDDNSPMYNVTGVQGAAPIWHDSMLLAEQGHPIRDFVNPGGLEHATVTYSDGVQTTDWFLPGRVPTFATTGKYPPTSPSPTSSSTLPPSKHSNKNPYCPSSFSFAFPPPSGSPTSPVPGWW